MIRVLYVLPELSAEAETAAQVRAQALLPRLARSVSLTVLAYRGKSDLSAQDAGFDIHHVSRRAMSSLKLALGTVRPGPRSFRRFDTPQARQCLAGLIDTLRPDIVHFDSFGTFGLIRVARQARHQPAIVAHSHDAQSLRYLRFSRAGRLRDRVQYYAEYRKILAFEKHTLPGADLTIVDSPEDRDYLAEWLGPRSALLPLGFDLATYGTEGPRADLPPQSVVYSGSMKARQSEDAAEFLAREVMPLVWQRFPESSLHIVGSSPTRVIQALASDRVAVTGFVEDLASYLRAATVYACPLRLGSGMRTRVIEALACGAVTVATDLAIRGLAPGDSGADPWMVEETAPGIAARICEVLAGGHGELAAQAAEYARSRYSWDAVGDQLLGYYDGIVDGRGGAR